MRSGGTNIVIWGIKEMSRRGIKEADNIGIRSL